MANPAHEDDDKPPVIEIGDAQADPHADGDGTAVRLPVLDDRMRLLEKVVYGKDTSDAQIDRELADDGAFLAIADPRHAEAVHKFDNVKGGTQGVESAQSLLPGDADKRAFVSTGALVPPYDPGTLVHLLEHSNSLRQNIDAYRTNIDSHGHHFKPTLNLESDDIDEQVAIAIFQDRVIGGDPDPQMPTEQEVADKIAEVRKAMKIERIKLGFFFKNCVLGESFVTHRMNTRQDLEVTGNGYWEVLRDQEGNIAQFILVPSWTVRINPQHKELVPVEQTVQATPITWTTRVYRRRFRTYLQLHEGQRVYFKEFGDPRVISGQTGKPYADVEELKRVEEHEQVANELLHFKIYSSRSPYGVPRWIGALLAVLGSRQAEEVNFLYFDNKGVPPLAMLVTGGRVTEETVQRVQDFIDNRIKGRGNFHKILILEAEPASGDGIEHTGRMKIELKPLTQAMHTDALFQKYDKENINKTGQAFRMPPLLRGDSRDFNRATAQAVLKFTEQQVFHPERQQFDDQINRSVLMDMGICYHEFCSNTPKTTDPEDQAKVIERLAKVGALVPRDIRVLAEEILNTELKRIDEPWVDIPIPLATSGRIAELVEGPGDLFDPGSGTSTQTPLGGGEPGPQGPDAEADVDVVVEQVLRDLVSMADLSGADLDAAGRKQPGQNAGFLKLPASIFTNGTKGASPEVLAAAKRMVRLHAVLRKAEAGALEAERAAAEFAAAKDVAEPNGEPAVEVVQVDRETWDGFGIEPIEED